MIIKKISETPIKKTVHNVDTRELYSQESAQAIHIKLEPGESLKPHITPVEVFFFVIEGTPDIMVGKETLTVEADSLVESPKDIPHCIYNNSENVVRVLVVKTPRPTTQTKLL
jgi:mannose-6-phosphate isomerase-like protein (cupin superfamily)